MNVRPDLCFIAASCTEESSFSVKQDSLYTFFLILFSLLKNFYFAALGHKLKALCKNC